jgi:hypothetical protein
MIDGFLNNKDNFTICFGRQLFKKNLFINKIKK